MKILIAGASGLIGSALQAELRTGGHQVRRLVRRTTAATDEYRWRPEELQVPREAIEWADGVVSLSGAPLGRLPWTRNYRREIYHSRINATRPLARAIRAAGDPPSVWVSGSAVGFYGDRPGEALTEESPPGDGFLSGVVTRWEAATAAADDVTRVVQIRTGLVMATGGALAPLALATRLGAGSTIGTGEQHWPWISLDDEARAIVHLLTSSSLAGPVNLSGPVPVASARITRALAEQMRRPHLFRLPVWLLRLVLGEPAQEMLLPDQNVIPERLLQDGFTYRHSTAEAAVAAAVAR